VKIILSVTSIGRRLADDRTIVSPADPKGIITAVDPDFVAISGVSAAGLIGHSHNAVRHPDMPSAAFAGMGETFKAGRAWLGVVRNSCASGDYYSPVDAGSPASAGRPARPPPGRARARRSRPGAPSARVMRAVVAQFRA
jgi:aerotaxis receptor